MRPYTFAIPAGGTYQVQLKGSYIHVLTAPVNDLFVRFDSGEPCPFYQGVGTARRYETVEFSSATGQTITVYLGDGEMRDARANANVNVSATVEPGNTFDVGGDVSVPSGAATLIDAVDLTRKYALICNPSSSTATFRIGPATVGATSGALLEPGTTLPIATTSPIYAFQNSGSAATLSIANIRKV